MPDQYKGPNTEHDWNRYNYGSSNYHRYEQEKDLIRKNSGPPPSPQARKAVFILIAVVLVGWAVLTPVGKYFKHRKYQKEAREWGAKVRAITVRDSLYKDSLYKATGFRLGVDPQWKDPRKWD